MLRAILIDDEENNLKSLNVKLRNHCPEIEVVALCAKAQDGLEQIELLHPDVVFLDIEMPIMNAFTLLRKLSWRNFELIFVTAYNHYAVQAIKFSALDYLVKPVEVKDLKIAVSRVLEKKMNSPNQRLELLLENVLGQQKEMKKIAVSSSTGLQFLKIAHIVFLEAAGNYTQLVMADSKKFMTSRTLKEYEEMLPADTFIRIHNSHIINKNYIEKYVRGEGGQVILEGGAILDISKRKKSEFLRIIGT
ncbi:MAG TPA: LytTR family DNA-binding domain-containing protein [Ginsengibacter sp.]|nr:LytTR family DNA-binding domain-containing protein [Ginsengibacter sp.]HRP18166.1 LytTR family DNA-binding domain-containing protein [Ginsengibacter sp.]HRP43634.1 LytTR family DNA-binding domain-containing protein [Ginsengibacter sp.]